MLLWNPPLQRIDKDLHVTIKKNFFSLFVTKLERLAIFRLSANKTGLYPSGAPFKKYINEDSKSNPKPELTFSGAPL
jgi:hypothetical protein